jgi:hypothetical protein
MWNLRLSIQSGLIILVASHRPGFGAETSTTDALSQVFDLTNKICSDLPVEGGHSIAYKAVAKATKPGEGVAEFQKEDYLGVKAKQFFDEVNNVAKCRVGLLEATIPRLLPSPYPTTNASADETTKAEILEDPDSFVTGVIDSICDLRLGMVELDSKGTCDQKLH